MKKNIIIAILSCLSIATFAQNTEENSPNRSDDPCARPLIETNPFNPKNTEWFSMRNRFNWFDYVTYHNGLKMSIPYFDVIGLYGGINGQRYFVNPFFDDNEAYLRHINLYDKPALYFTLAMDNNYNNYSQLVDQMDITSKEQGWELLWKFDGYESDGMTPIVGAGINQVKALNFMLYNRYTGMLRWFMAPKVNNTTFNELEPVIEFKGNNVASLFRNYNGLDQALDKPTVVQRVASPAQTSSSTQHLSMADFNISYDPCVCYFDSKLGYTLNGNTTANLDLYGRLEGTSQMLSANDAINTDRLLSVYKNSVNSGFPNQVKNGLLEYKNYPKMLADFKKLEKKSNIFDDVYDASKVVGDIAEFGLDAFLSTKKPWKSLKTISKFTGFASMPFKTDKGTKSPPMLIQAQMTLTGQLNANTNLNGFSFDMHTPGSYKTSSDLNILNSPNNPNRFEYPVYNQAMGLYALLKTPQKELGIASINEVNIKAISVIPKYDNFGFEIGTTPIDSVLQSYTYSPRVAYKLKEDIEFTFNPSAQINFEATKIEAAWIIEVENAPSANTSNNLWDFTSLNMSKTYTYLNSYNKNITVYSGEFMPIECISQFVPVFDFSLTNNAFRTDYRNPFPNSPNPIFLINHLSQHINKISLNKPNVVNTYLKINILYRYNKPDGTGLNDIVNFETYKYEIEGTTANNNILSLPNIIELSSPSELTIENRDFTANETIFAWDKITLKGFVKTSNGASVVIKSAGEIIVEPETEIDPEITLLIGKPSLCNPTRIQPTVIDASYCNNQSKYKANTSLSKTSNQPVAKPIKDTEKPTIQFNIYPNPANDVATVLFQLNGAIGETIHIYNLAGTLVRSVKITGNNQETINTQDLAAGVYLVTLNASNGYSETKKLIITK